MKGTLHYAAPEQRTTTNYTFSVDMYACGYVFLELYYPMTSLSERIRVFEAVRKETKLPADFAARQVKYLSRQKTHVISQTLRTLIDKVPLIYRFF